MKKQIISEMDSTVLRQQTELKLKQKMPQTYSQLSESQMLKLIHELEVDKIELELQNEELNRIKRELILVSAAKVKGLKQAEGELIKQNKFTARLAIFSNELSVLPAEENLEVYICKRIKELTGSVLVLFSEFDSEKRIITPTHLELEPGLLQKVIGFLGTQIQNLNAVVDDETYRKITKCIVGKYATLTDSTFGVISQTAGAILSGLIKADRYIGLSYLVEGKLYGTSLLAMNKSLPDPPIEVLENIAFLVGVSLRRKRAESALKDSEHKYKVITQSTLDVIFIVDKSGKELFVNEQIEKILGYKSNEVIGRSFTEFVPKELVPNYLIQLGKVFLQQEVKGFVTQIYHKNGHLVDVEINGRLIRLNGEFVGQGTIRDITESKRIQEELSKSLERNRALLKANPDMMFVFDAQCKIVDYHAESAEQLFVSPEVLLNKVAEKIFPAEISELTRQKVRGVLETGKADYSTYELLVKGQLQYFEARYVPCGKKEVLAIVRDISERKIAEEALVRSEEKLSSILNSTKDVVWSSSWPDFKVQFISPSAETIFGRPLPDFYHSSTVWKDIVHPDDFHLTEESLARLHKTGKSTRECRIIHPDGRIAWIYEKSELIYDSNHHPIRVDGIASDITDRHQAEQQLVRLNDCFLKFGYDPMININMLVAVCGELLGATCSLYNRMESDMLCSIGQWNTPPGFKSVDRPEGHLCNDVIHATDENLLIVRDLPNTAYFMTDPNVGLYQLKTYIGKAVKFNKQNVGSLCVVFQRDFTPSNNEIHVIEIIASAIGVEEERKEAQIALQESEMRFKTLFEGAPDSIVLVNPETLKIVDVNDAACRLLQRSANELVGMFHSELHPAQSGDFAKTTFEQQLNESRNQGYTLPVETKVVRPDGSTVPVEIVAQLINFRNQTEMMGTFRDISDRKQAEKEIRSKNDELQRLNVEKDKFFSIIAHDLRSPFNSFLGLTQIMAEELPTLTMSQIQNIAINMKNSATNLYNLLENLLQWARIQQGAIPFSPELIHLQRLVDYSVSIALEPAKLKNIEISYSISNDLSVFADSNIVQTVIRNLVTNAVKFTPKGGCVHLSAKLVAGNTIELAISDSGIGMSQSMLENLFKIDVQTNRKGTEGEPSTGLGLVLCNDFIKMYGGTIWVESEEDKGSTFYFTIPCTNFRF